MLLKINRVKSTWQFMKVNFKTKECYSVYIQLALKEPWLLPKHDNHFGNLDIPLWGWLFFYFGRITEGLLSETSNEDAKIIDKRTGKKYYLYRLVAREDKDIARAAIKKHVQWRIQANEDGTCTVVAND